MENFDQLLKEASDLPQELASTVDADAPAAVLAPTTLQRDAEASAEAERLLRELCGVKKPVLRILDRPPSRRAA